MLNEISPLRQVVVHLQQWELMWTKSSELSRQSQQLEGQPRARARVNMDNHLHSATDSRLRKVAVLPNTKKQTQRVEQNEKENERIFLLSFVGNERIRQNFRKTPEG